MREEPAPRAARTEAVRPLRLPRGRLATGLTGLALFAAAVALYAIVQWATPAIVGNDGYYHIKMAYLMRREGIKPAFDALPYTILNAADYYDHHLLFHVYLAPFAGVDPAADGGAALTLGAKVATVLLSALGVVALWWLLRGQRVPFAAVWALATFAVSSAFLYRMSMTRAQSGAVLFLLLAVHWLLTGRHRWLAPLGFVFVWFYNAFPLLLVVAAVYVIAAWLLERRVVWAALLYPAAGIGLGLIINPYFPVDLTFIAAHVLPKVGQSAVPVGVEWDPYETWTLVHNSGAALAAVLLGALALGWREKRIDLPALVGLGLVAVFGLMLFKSRRFVEYFPPFALLFLALAAAPLLGGWRARARGASPWLAAAIALAALAVLITITLSGARTLVAASRPADTYADAMLWLRRERSPGAVIFQTDWDDFTRQFFYDDEARYVSGLDPTFMQMYDQQLYDEWVDITRGRVNDPGASISRDFGAQYVFSDLNHHTFLAEAATDPTLTEVYRDEYAVVFAVRP